MTTGCESQPFGPEILDVEKDVSDYIGTPAGPGGDWSDDQAAQIMEPHLDAVVAAWLRVAYHVPINEGGFAGVEPQTLVQAATVDHAEALTERFNKVNGASTWGDCQLSAVASRIRGTGHRVSCGPRARSDLGGETHGWIRCARGGLFRVRAPDRRLLPWVQSIGRIMRTGSPTATVVDCTGNAARFAARLHRFWANGAVVASAGITEREPGAAHVG